MIDFERLVKAEDVLVAISRYTDETGHIDMHIGSIQSIIDNVPTADRPHAEWEGEPEKHNLSTRICSSCGDRGVVGYFCMWCGADMRKEGEAE